jgi:hypothetical protein
MNLSCWFETGAHEWKSHVHNMPFAK